MKELIEEKVKELRKKFEKDMWDLGVEYATHLFNETKITPGDIVESTTGDKILFEKRGLRINTIDPTRSYFVLIGKRLKKDNTPRKDNSSDSIYFENVKEIIKNVRDN